MALPTFTAITSGQIDAGSPVDETLMQSLKDRDEYMKTTSETLMWIRYGLEI